MVNKFKRWLYVRAMMKAIRGACNKTMHKNQMPLTYGLRVIKRFERINKVKFDPFDSAHCDIIYGCANDEAFFRMNKIRMNRINREAIDWIDAQPNRN